MRITERSVKALAVPANGQAIYFDDDVKGFGVRVTSAGCRSWIVEVRRGSRSQRITIGRVAELSAAEARSRAIDIKRGGIVRRERHRATIEDAWTQYAADRRGALASSTWRRVESRMRVHVLPTVAHVRLADFDAADVTRVISQIKGAVLANRTLEDLRAVLGHALALGWVARNVTIGMRKRKEIHRERYLKREELETLFDALPQIPSADLIWFLVLTGCRLNEARLLMWSDIHGDIWVKRAITTKARRTHSVPLLPAALAIIQKQKRRGLYVFSRCDGSPIGSVQRVWETARRKAGLPDLRIHDLRHTVASLALQGGVSLPVVGKMLGHSTPAVTHRYAHLEIEHLREGFAKVLPTKKIRTA
jgi:integrase